MKLTVSTKPIPSDLAAFFICQDEQLFTMSIKKLKTNFPAAAVDVFANNEFSGKEGESVLLYTNDKKFPRVLLVGMGENEKFTIEKLRRATAAAAKKGRALKIESITMHAPDVNKGSAKEIAVAMSEAILLSLYKFDKYISDDKNGKKIKNVSFVPATPSDLKEFQQGVIIGEILAEGTIHTRDLANAPGNEIYPETLAKDAQALGHRLGFSVNVFDKKKIQSLGMGGIIGVSKGSENDPRFIIMEYGKQFKKQGTVVLVGKGVTFDTGGISIKPAASMAEMKMDMSGAAAVIGTFHSIAKLKLKRHVIGLIPSVENMPSGTAFKPGDIIRHYNGKTSEVDNTDAEGRLILADALSYASQYKPDVVIDLATLTGAVVVALGQHATGMMGNDQGVMDALRDSGEKTYERVWQLPLFDEYEKQIKSDVADVKNVGGRWAGAITAGWFLKKFIGDYKWVHLDIAGTAILESDKEYTSKGGSGVGVRLLTEFLIQWKNS
ncbi:MAG: leucyl aminopeptidase [Ignavibacteriales bacterium]|nr:leucyl aminopeptidase [Ignavibacteriales bacterium]